MIKKKSYDKIMCSALWIYVRWPMAHQWGFLKWSTCEKKKRKSTLEQMTPSTYIYSSAARDRPDQFGSVVN